MYNETKRTVEIEGNQVSVLDVARALTPEQFALLVDQFCNSGMKQFKEGVVAGKHLQGSHRTIQRQVICLCLGILDGLSDQKYTDARNETAVETCKKLHEMIWNGELPMGAFI